MTDPFARWQAVQARDARQDGAFVYAVSSTGIYCRPSCPSRRPRQDRVRFFDTCVAAEAAGYRACRRCRPRAERSAAAELAARVCAAIEAHPPDALPTLAALGAAVAVSPSHLQRTFKRVMGVTPRQWAAGRRRERFVTAVQGSANVAEALYAAGYSGPSRLYETAHADHGMTPATLQKGAPGQTIGYTTAACPLGRLLVAATPRGLCAVHLADTDAALLEELQSRFPKAVLHRDEAALAAAVAALVAHLGGTPRALDLPLDLQATAFRLRVWTALRAIPYGETRTYAEVAQAIGQPTATRAVAQACAANPVALVTPCHRVVRSDGQPGGYRWGVARKQALLEREQIAEG